MKNLLGSTINENDAVLEFYLENASNIICDIRNTNVVEPKYRTVQVMMAIEMYNKRGAEGQISHTENGIIRMYERADISPSLISKITPSARTPFSSVRDVVE